MDRRGFLQAGAVTAAAATSAAATLAPSAASAQDARARQTKLICAYCPLLWAQSFTLDLPPRPANAPGGSTFAHSIADLSLPEREAKVLAEIKAGNIPNFLRTFVPVTTTRDGKNATYFVAPDYLAIGSDDDYFLTPLSPWTAQKIADLLGCCLPTPKMVDDIYKCAAVKLAPAPIAPSPAMTTVPVFLKHNEMVRTLRKQAENPQGALVAGHKKDVVIANKVFAASGKVAIYGWHKLDGKPIQALYTGHTARWVDYSHGIRLVGRKLAVSGQPKTIEAVLADPDLARLLSNEGVMHQVRYGREADAAHSTSIEHRQR
jgi:hypothetical protein